MSETIISTGGRISQSFVCQLTSALTKPNAKFIRDFLCGVLFSDNLVLTHVAARVPCAGKLTAVARQFRRQLANCRPYPEQLWYNYLSVVRRRLNGNSLFIVDLSDLAKPYAKRMEYLAWVRDGDKGCLVPGYWCMEVYCLDKEGSLILNTFSEFCTISGFNERRQFLNDYGRYLVTCRHQKEWLLLISRISTTAEIVLLDFELSVGDPFHFIQDSKGQEDLSLASRELQ